jgi:hypothetical protein
MLLYHASNVLVDKPRILSSNRALDFGAGFYTTTHRKQAENFAAVTVRRRGGHGIINQYDYDEIAAKASARILTFDKADKTWLDFVCENRNGAYHGEAYDIIHGPVANDRVFSVVTLYMSGQLSESAALEAIKPFKLYTQIVFKTELALTFLKYLAKEEL